MNKPELFKRLLKKNNYLLNTSICLAVWRALRRLHFSFSRQGAKIAKTAKKAKNRYKTFFYLAWCFL